MKIYKLNNLTLKELNEFCKNKKIKNYTLNSNKKKLINHIIKYLIFNNLKKKEDLELKEINDAINALKIAEENELNDVIKLSIQEEVNKKKPYDKRINKEVKLFNNSYFGEMIYKDNTITFTKKNNIYIKLSNNYPFEAPTMCGDFFYEYKNWSPASTLNDFVEGYISIIPYINSTTIGNNLTSENNTIDDNNLTSENNSSNNNLTSENNPVDNSLNSVINNLKNILNNNEIIFHKNNNEYMLENYKNYKKYLIKNNNFKNNEEILFHGTDFNDIQSILDNDFCLTKNIKHGSMYGKGIYFTNDINLAIRYSEKMKNDKYILLCKVYIGNIINGKPNMDILPKIENTNNYYDTAVDNINNPKQFIKKKNNQYIILGYIHIKFNNYKPIIFNQYNKNKINNKYKDIRKGIKFINLLDKNIKIYFNKDNNKLLNIDITKMKLVGNLNKNEELKLYSFKDHEFICGYNDNEYYFNIIKIHKVKDENSRNIVKIKN